MIKSFFFTKGNTGKPKSDSASVYLQLRDALVCHMTQKSNMVKQPVEMVTQSDGGKGESLVYDSGRGPRGYGVLLVIEELGHGE